MPNLYSHGIEPIQKHEMIFAHTPTGSLWKHWDAEWLHHMGVIAVVDTRYMLMGILRPYDILHRLIQQRTSVHHLWPYTHVVEHSWADRLSDFDEIPVADLVRDRGVVMTTPSNDWVPAMDLFTYHRTPVIWIANQNSQLYGKITWESVSIHLASHR